MAGLFDNMFGKASGGLFGNVEEDPQLSSFLGGRPSSLSNSLLGLGAGIAGGSTWGESVSGGIRGIAAARAADQQRQQLVAQAQTLMQMGLPPQHAIMAVQNPEMMKAILPHVVPKYDHVTNGPLGGAFNAATGRVSQQYAAPSWQALSPGQTGGWASPPGFGAPAAAAPAGAAPVAAVTPPGMRVGPGFTPAATSPEKPPTDMLWRDPADPSKGVDAIPGSAATQLTEGMSAKLAMIESAKPELAAARTFFGESFSNFDPRNVVGQRLFAGEIGRRQRGVKMAAEAALRMATGAAAPTSEDLKYIDFYIPSVYDSLATRNQKLDALQRFMTIAERNMLQGRTTRIQDHIPKDAAPASVKKETINRDPLGTGL